MKSLRCACHCAIRGNSTARGSACGDAFRGFRPNQAFTLIELMLVVAIMVIALTMSYPMFSNFLHREPVVQATQDVIEGCRKAREMAILHGEDWELRIEPQTGHIEIGKAPVDTDPNATQTNAAADPNNPVYIDPDAKPKSSQSFSADISDHVRIELLDVNFVEYKQSDLARVRFSPNGTSDDFTIIMSCEGEFRQVSLEVVTALAEVESDPQKFGRAK